MSSSFPLRITSDAFEALTAEAQAEILRVLEPHESRPPPPAWPTQQPPAGWPGPRPLSVAEERDAMAAGGAPRTPPAAIYPPAWGPVPPGAPARPARLTRCNALGGAPDSPPAGGGLGPSSSTGTLPWPPEDEPDTPAPAPSSVRLLREEGCGMHDGLYDQMGNRVLGRSVESGGIQPTRCYCRTPLPPRGRVAYDASGVPLPPPALRQLTDPVMHAEPARNAQWRADIRAYEAAGGRISPARRLHLDEV